ncbi:hypothetical protein ACFL0W_01535 [Nanoarchaeota archaeon]
MKIGFGILCYDKFEEVRMLADIIKGYDKNFYVLACSNHPEGKKHLETYKHIDRVVLGEDFPIHGKPGTEQRRMHLNSMRATSNMLRCNTALMENKDIDYCIFLHSDSWILDKKSIFRIINLIKKKKKKIAIRGTGISYMVRPTPLGNIDDMFMFYERKFIKESKMFEFDVLQMFPHKLNSHGMISTSMMVKVGIANVLQYKNTAELYLWHNKYLSDRTQVAETNNPCIFTYDPDYKFIHTHVGALPDDLGFQLQAYYLRKFKMKGPTIDKFLERYTMGAEELFKKIKVVDKKVKWLLFRNFLTYKSLGWGKNYLRIINFFKNAPFKEKVRVIFLSNLKQAIVKFVGLDRLLYILYGAKVGKERLPDYYKRMVTKDKRIDEFGHKRWYLDFKDKNL